MDKKFSFTVQKAIFATTTQTIIFLKNSLNTCIYKKKVVTLSAFLKIII